MNSIQQVPAISRPSAELPDPLPSTPYPLLPSTTSWQQVMKEAVRDVSQLCQLLDLPRRFVDRAATAAHDFPLFVPRPFLARMRRGDPCDPLLRQVLPLEAETIPAEGFTL